VKSTLTSRFPLTPAAWLVSICLLSGVSIQATLADDLPTFSAQPRPQESVKPAPAPVRKSPLNQNDALVSFAPEAVPVAQGRPATAGSVIANPKSAAVVAQAKDSGIATFTAASQRPVSAAVSTSSASQLNATASTRKKEQLLSFSSVTATPTVTTTAPARPVNETPVRPTPAAKTNGPHPVVEQTHSVSALALAALPPRMAARRGAGNTVLGPSEAELREVFNRAVETAIDRAPTIFRAKAEQEAANADVDEAKGQRWPQVDVGTQTSPIKFGKGSDEESGSGGINLAVTTPLYDWGRIRNSIDSRKRLSSAADESLEAEKETTGYEVVTTLVELGKQRIIVDLSQQFADRMDDLVKMLAGIVAVDKGRYSELTQAKARLLQAQALRDAADAKARDAEITLRKLVGDRPIPIPRTKEWNIRLVNLDQLLEDAKSHPTIRQATAEAESADLQAKAVRAGGLPQLNWVVSKSTAEDSIGREQPWQTNLTMTWGAFRGGSTRAAERAALQRADASRYQTDQQRRDLEFRIRTADNDARTQLERAELYRDLAVESGQIREDFYLQWHHLGKRTLLDVLSAENEHYGNQVSEITNRFDGYQAILRQYASAGTLARWLRGGQ
jgi:adhesin transport system outer membrane protein